MTIGSNNEPTFSTSIGFSLDPSPLGEGGRLRLFEEALPLVGPGIGGNTFLDEPDKGFLAPEG